MPVLKNPKHEAFAQGLAKGLSASEAYVTAGFKANDGNAIRMKGNERVQARVAELSEKAAERAEVSIARVLQELARIGLSDPSKALDDEGRLLPLKEMDEDTRRAISSVEVEQIRSRKRDGDEEDDEIARVHKIKFWDKNSALEKIAKHLGMFVEKHEHSGPGGSALIPVVNVTLSGGST